MIAKKDSSLRGIETIQKNVLSGGNGRSAGEGAHVWDVSLSTMWGIKQFPRIEDCFTAAGQLGFASIELNHQVSSEMLSGIQMERYRFSSIHEPCPADIPVETLKKRDWLISATDEDGRRQGVLAIKRSIQFAHELGVGVVVVHTGTVQIDLGLELRLRSLYDAGQVDTQEYQDLKENMVRTRARLASPRFEAVKKSLRELLDYAQRFNVRLSLENRYHYMDMPNPDEMEILLGLADASRLGFTLDIGHAQTLDRLGFYPYEEWPRRFAARILVVHLHDVIGLRDHYAPGQGEVDFKRVASYLPENAIRTCELNPINSPEKIMAGIQLLVETGCIRSH